MPDDLRDMPREPGSRMPSPPPPTPVEVYPAPDGWRVGFHLVGATVGAAIMGIGYALRDGEMTGVGLAVAAVCAAVAIAAAMGAGRE